MINIPVSKPNLVKAGTFAAGIAAFLISQKYPTYSPIVKYALELLGIAGVAAGRPQIIQSPVKS